MPFSVQLATRVSRHWRWFVLPVLAACSADNSLRSLPSEQGVLKTPAAAASGPGTPAVALALTAPSSVTDLSVSATTDTSATVSLTQVSDGNGMAASYDVRFAVAPISWGSGTTAVRGTCATPLAGTSAGTDTTA